MAAPPQWEADLRVCLCPERCPYGASTPGCATATERWEGRLAGLLRGDPALAGDLVLDLIAVLTPPQAGAGRTLHHTVTPPRRSGGSASSSSKSRSTAARLGDGPTTTVPTPH